MLRNEMELKDAARWCRLQSWKETGQRQKVCDKSEALESQKRAGFRVCTWLQRPRFSPQLMYLENSQQETTL